MKITEKTVLLLKTRSTATEYRDDELKGFLIRVQPSGHKSYYYEHCFNGKTKNFEFEEVRNEVKKNNLSIK